MPCVLSKSEIRQPPIRAFMDDLAVTTSAVRGARLILQVLEREEGLTGHRS